MQCFVAPQSIYDVPLRGIFVFIQYKTRCDWNNFFPPNSLLKRDYLKLNLSTSLLVECNNLLIMFQKSGHKWNKSLFIVAPKCWTVWTFLRGSSFHFLGEDPFPKIYFIRLLSKLASFSSQKSSCNLMYFAWYTSKILSLLRLFINVLIIVFLVGSDQRGWRLGAHGDHA